MPNNLSIGALRLHQQQIEMFKFAALAARPRFGNQSTISNMIKETTRKRWLSLLLRAEDTKDTIITQK